MNETAMEVLGKARTRKQPWMTQDILNACDKRRELKAKRFIDSDKEKEYRNANIKVRKEIKKAKEEFLEQKRYNKVLKRITAKRLLIQSNS